MSRGALTHGALSRGALSRGALTHGALSRGAPSCGALTHDALSHGVGKETSRMDYATRYSREDENNMLNSLAHSFSVLREKWNTVFRPAKMTLKSN